MKQNYDINLITKYYFEEKLSLQEVADRIGYRSAGGVSLILKRHGFNIRKQNAGSRNKKHQLNSQYFKEINTKKKAYLLGLLIADGTILQKWNKVTLALKDKELVELFKCELESTHKLSEYDIHDKRTGKTYKRYSLQVPSKELVDDLAALGVYDAKSFTCDLPKINEQYFWHFVRGLFDGDGTVGLNNTKKDGALQFSIIGSEKLILSLKERFNKFGLSETKVSYPGYKSLEGVISRIHYYSYNDLKILCDNMYADSDGCRLERKYEIFKTLREYKAGRYDRTKSLRKVRMLDLKGNLIKDFEHIHEACEKIGATYRMVHRVAMGERSQTKGYRFEYL